MEHAKHLIEQILEVFTFGIEVVAGIILVIGAVRFLVTVGWRSVSGRENDVIVPAIVAAVRPLISVFPERERAPLREQAS